MLDGGRSSAFGVLARFAAMACPVVSWPMSLDALCPRPCHVRVTSTPGRRRSAADFQLGLPVLVTRSGDSLGRLAPAVCSDSVASDDIRICAGLNSFARDPRSPTAGDRAEAGRSAARGSSQPALLHDDPRSAAIDGGSPRRGPTERSPDRGRRGLPFGQAPRVGAVSVCAVACAQAEHSLCEPGLRGYTRLQRWASPICDYTALFATLCVNDDLVLFFNS